jgi:hypothetical protein
MRGICIDSGVQMPHIRQVAFVPCSDEWRCSFPAWFNVHATVCLLAGVRHSRGSFGCVAQGVVYRDARAVGSDSVYCIVGHGAGQLA